MRMARTVSRLAALGAPGALAFLAACGDPVPPAAQGAVSLYVAEVDDATRPNLACPPGRHWANAPHDSSARVQFQQTSAEESGPKAVNGQGGNSVSCSVKASGSKFIFSGRITSAASRDGMKINNTNIQLGIPMGISPGDTNATGLVSIQDDASINAYIDRNCSFSVQPSNEREMLGVDSGRIWGKVTCENLADDRAPGSVCLVSPGFFVFENCAE